MQYEQPTTTGIRPASTPEAERAAQALTTALTAPVPAVAVGADDLAELLAAVGYAPRPMTPRRAIALQREHDKSMRRLERAAARRAAESEAESRASSERLAALLASHPITPVATIEGGCGNTE